MYRMVLYPVHPLIFKIVFKKMGRAVLHAGLLFPSPNQVPPRFRRGRIGDAGRCVPGLKFSSGQRRRGGRCP